MVKDDDGKVLASLTFKNDRRGISDFVEGLKRFRDVRVAVESRGNFWVKLYNALEENGVRVVLSNPAKTRAIARLRLGRIGLMLQRLLTFYVLVWLLKLCSV